MNTELSLKLLGGAFLQKELPPDFSYLNKYFHSETTKAFANYYVVFNSLLEENTIQFFLDNFVDHTGFNQKHSVLRRLINRLKYIIAEKEKAELNLDFDTLDKIKSGDFDVNVS